MLGLQLEWWETAHCTGDPSVACNSYFQWQSSYWEAISCKHPSPRSADANFRPPLTDKQPTNLWNSQPKMEIHKKNSAQGFTKLLSWFLDCFPKISPKSHWRTHASGWDELPRLLYCPWLQLILNRSGVLSGPGLITLWIIQRSISMGDHDPCILTDGVPGTGYTGYFCPPTAASPLCHSGLRNLPRSLHSKKSRTVKSLHQSFIHSFVITSMHIFDFDHDDIPVAEIYSH